MARKFYYPDELPAKVVENLARKVEAAKGKVVVLVHPFFTDGGADLGEDDYFHARGSVLGKSRFPVIILEEYYVGPERDSQLGKKSKIDLILPTGVWSPYIIFKSGDRSIFSSPEKSTEFLVGFLHRIGAKTILTGGMMANRVERSEGNTVAMKERKWQRDLKAQRGPEHVYLDKPVIDGCAGLTYKALVESGLFKVRWMTKLMYPSMKSIVGAKTFWKRPYVRPGKRPSLPGPKHL